MFTGMNRRHGRVHYSGQVNGDVINSTLAPSLQFCISSIADKFLLYPTSHTHDQPLPLAGNKVEIGCIE